MPVRRQLSSYPRPQSRFPELVHQLERHHERNGYSRMSESIVSGVDRHINDSSDGELGPITLSSSTHNGNPGWRFSPYSHAEVVDDPRPILSIRNPDDPRCEDEYTTASDSSASDEPIDEAEYEDIYFESSDERIQDARSINRDIDVFHRSSWSEWFEVVEMVEMGRVERTKWLWPWRTLPQMYRIQARALRAAINAEARQNVADFQRIHNCVVEVSSGDESESYEDLSSRSENTNAFEDDLDDSWNEYIHDCGSETLLVDDNRSLIDNITWFFDKKPVPLTVRYDDRARDRDRRTRIRERLANSVLNLGTASLTSLEWCPCLNFGPGPDELRKAHCKAVRDRRHCQRRLLEDAYVLQSRGYTLEDGHEASLYIRYILAVAQEQFLERQWNNAPLSDQDSAEEAVDALLRLELKMEEDPVFGGEVERVLTRERYVASHPSKLLACFQLARK